LHRARSWACKWHKRYSDGGLEGLRDKPRSGRPPFVDEDTRIKIKMELEDGITGWDFRQVMHIIQKTTGQVPSGTHSSTIAQMGP
jgi:transposase